MSKSVPKIKHTRKPHKPLGEPKRPTSQKTKSILWISLVGVLAVIPFSLGKYFEFGTPGAFDSGAYTYSAAHILDGAEIGVEEIPSAQLGTLLVNILGVRLFGYSDFGPKLVQMFLQAGALILMFIAMRKLFGSILPAAVGVVIASAYLSAPLIAKYGNVKEQYMIAFMIMGMSCFVLYELSRKWWVAILAGGLLAWAPLFKPTGMSAIGAVGLFVVAQPVLKHCAFKRAGRDILLLLAGAAGAMAPLYVWILGWDVQLTVPYGFIWYTLRSFIPSGSEAAQTTGDYISGARRLVPWSEQWPRVLRYYGLLILPIAPAIGAIALRVLRLVRRKASAMKPESKSYDRFVLLFGAWWVLDMAFVWISPRSYEQYYLPLNASAAMLSGYVIAIYFGKAKTSLEKGPWVTMGVAALVAMTAMSWHIFFGIKTSPHTGQPYGRRVRGYLQKYREVAARREGDMKGPWEAVGEYMRANSGATDKIYVWGWFPGIYVSAQRFSSASKAFCMPRKTPAALAGEVEKLLSEFKEEMPKFIVDARKRHIPTIRPPYELWPIVMPPTLGVAKPRFLRPIKSEIDAYDKEWHAELAEFEEAEALRYDELKPFREFVMSNYSIVRMFGQHVLFELKNRVGTEEPK